MKLCLKDKIPFGKHKGKTIKEIIKSDPQYLYWVCENIEWFALSTKAQKALPDKIDLKSIKGLKIGIADRFGSFLEGGSIGEYAQLALDSEPFFDNSEEEEY